MVKQPRPFLAALGCSHECFCVANHDQRVPRPGYEDIQTFRSSHETNLSVLVASGQRRYDDIALFTLVIVNRGQPDRFLVDIRARRWQDASLHEVMAIEVAQDRVVIMTQPFSQQRQLSL